MQLRAWITDRITGRQTNNCLLVTGPCGCGKATAIQLLCDELDLDLIEFELEARVNGQTAQTSSYNYSNQATNHAGDSQIVHNVAHMDALKSFLIDTRQMTMDTRTRTRKLLLIKELPDALYKYV